MLIILDGWGVNIRPDSNAIHLARTPFYNSLLADFPNTVIDASGEAVGLPEGQMGNSEVGHLNLGAGRIIYQEFTRISKAARNGELLTNDAINKAISKVLKNKSTLHLMGLVSDGGVHSHMDHLKALVDVAISKRVDRICIHAFLDGRDTPPSSGIGYIKDLESFLKDRGKGVIATVSGRFYAMDRDNRWDRVEKAYGTMTRAEGRRAASAEEAVLSAYEFGETDEFVVPTSITDGRGHALGTVKDGDAVIFFNFRADRAREITRAFTEKNFSEFTRGSRPVLGSFVCMTEYDEKFGLPVAFPPQRASQLLGELISRKGMKQLRIAETEKYAHVTFFFNGGDENTFPGEDRCLIPSPKSVSTYDQKPSMSAEEVTNEVIARLDSDQYDVIVLNFANPDMVGHTGKLNAAVEACEVIDVCLRRIYEKLAVKKGVALITADHGNCEQMVDYTTGEPHTAHTCNVVPFILTIPGIKLRSDGILADVAPTMLQLLNLPQPPEMTGKSLIIK
ncbi:MAG: 2,3-bisphosphoglycerate-independent phosphoglycerate mutase [Nitrospirota bacterium]|nr:2,3-bisphosphoglycerate-independent phosphoglycerate mutase [Nitrospirota bacterium]